jgi:hypothetical protein
MFAYSMELLLQQPAALLAAEIRTWSGQQGAAMPEVPLADLLFHAVRKVAGLAEFDLVSNESLAARVKELGEAVIPFCPPEDREVLRQNLEKLTLAPAAAAATLGGLEMMQRPSSPRATNDPTRTGLPGKVASGLRKLGIFLERLQPRDAAAPPPEERTEVASQFISTAAVESRNQKELEEQLAPLRQLGIDTSMEKVVGALAQSLPGWGALPAAAGAAPPPVGVELKAMRQIVTLAEDPADAGKRFRELVHVAIEQFNAGHLGRAVSMFELAEQLAADKKVESAFVDVLRETGHEYLDTGRLRTYAERTDLRASLCTVMSFFLHLRPEGLLSALDGEPRRERRHDLLALLEAHGAPARARARDLLAASLTPGAGVDPFFQMNLVYLLRVIPRPPEASVEDEVNLAMRTSGKDSPPPLVKQVIAYLAATRHEKSERALITYLRVFENMLLEPDTAVYPREDVETLLDRTSVALSRYATPRAWRALVDHGLKTDAKLGTPMARLVEAGRQDLSASKDLVSRLIAALKAELPRNILGFSVGRKDDRIGWLVQALAGTPLPEVRAALQDVVDRYPGQGFADAAAAALSSLGAAAKPTETPGLSGDLELFGLPGLLQTLSQSQLTGLLTLMNSSGQTQATVVLQAGRFRDGRFGNLRGTDAMYQLFERPFPGTFAFVSRTDVEDLATGAAEEVISLLLEGVRRHDEFKRAAILVPDDLLLQPTGAPWTPLPDEDPDFAHFVWTQIAKGGTARACEATVATDSFRIRRLLAHWLEEGALAPA